MTGGYGFPSDNAVTLRNKATREVFYAAKEFLNADQQKDSVIKVETDSDFTLRLNSNTHPTEGVDFIDVLRKTADNRDICSKQLKDYFVDAVLGSGRSLTLERENNRTITTISAVKVPSPVVL